MTISERIFERLAELSMTQKEFSEKTGILPSTISEWKKNKTNPSSDKIMVICKTLKVSPEWLLSGIDAAKSREKNNNYYIIDKNTSLGRVIAYYNLLNPYLRERALGYIESIKELRIDDSYTDRDNLNLVAENRVVYNVNKNNKEDKDNNI